jgi:hypothetical protein
MEASEEPRSRPERRGGAALKRVDRARLAEALAQDRHPGYTRLRLMLDSVLGRLGEGGPVTKRG